MITSPQALLNHESSFFSERKMQHGKRHYMENNLFEGKNREESRFRGGFQPGLGMK